MLKKLFVLGLFVITVLGCGSSQTKRNPSDEKVLLKDSKGETKVAPPAPVVVNPSKEMVPVNPSPSEKEATQKAEEIKKAVESAAQHIQTAHDQSARSARKVGSVSAEKSLGWLKHGNIRFTERRFRKDGVSAKDRLRLVSQQTPHAVILSCSDSQVPPEIIFDQKLGEIFVVRTFGQALDNNVIGSIEQAVLDLGSNLIVILGHTSCDAVSSALSSLKGMSAASPALEAMANDLKPRLKQYATKTPSKDMIDESWSNVEGISKDLQERSAILRDAIGSGDVKIVQAMYHLDSGKVDWR
ncbi:MAG: carbonic anhydrase [Bdellovibrio sp.]